MAKYFCIIDIFVHKRVDRQDTLWYTATISKGDGPRKEKEKEMEKMELENARKLVEEAKALLLREFYASVVSDAPADKRQRLHDLWAEAFNLHENLLVELNEEE